MFFPLRSFDDRQKDIFLDILTEWRRVTLISIFYKGAKGLEKTGMINFVQATDTSFENQAQNQLDRLCCDNSSYQFLKRIAAYKLHKRFDDTTI